jgi:hypothetical protein
MLEKLATHDVQYVSELFILADKCTWVAKGHDWHSQPSLDAEKAVKPDADATAQDSGKKKKKKKVGDKDKPLAGAPTVAAAAADEGRGPLDDKRPCLLSISDDGGQRCPIHKSKWHNTEECREIKKLAEQVREQQKQQQRQDGAPPRQ